MCWEDLVIGRKIKSTVWNTLSTIDIPANGNRIGIKICAGGNGMADLYIRSNGTFNPILHAVNNNPGTTETSDTNSDFTSLWEIGDSIYSDLRLTSSNGGLCTAIETWINDPPDVAAKVNTQP